MTRILSNILFFALFATATVTCHAQVPAQQGGIKWMSIEEAQKLNKKEPRKILIDTYTDWCGWCKRLDATTYQDKRVINYVNANFYAVKLNAEQATPINFNGKVYNYNPANRCNDIAVYLLSGQMGYPTTIFLDKGLNIVTHAEGYMQADQMLQTLKYITQELYKKVDYDTFSKNPSQYLKN